MGLTSAQEIDVEEVQESPLNDGAWDLVHQLLTQLDDLRIEPVCEEQEGIILDFGVEASG